MYLSYTLINIINNIYYAFYYIYLNNFLKLFKLARLWITVLICAVEQPWYRVCLKICI